MKRCLLLLCIAWYGLIQDTTDEHSKDQTITTKTVQRQTSQDSMRIKYIIGNWEIPQPRLDYLVNFLLHYSAQWFFRNIEINRLQEPYLQFEDTCGGFEFTDYMQLMRFVGYDVYIVVNCGQDIPTQGSYAYPCVVDATTGQTILGHIWLNSDLLDLSTHSDNFHNMIAQTLHVIAFHPNLFPYWNSGSYGDCSTYFSDCPVKKMITHTQTGASISTHGEFVFKLASTNVLDAIQSHFSCDSLDGLELAPSTFEDWPGSNWHKLYMFNEILANNFDESDAVVSPITEAMLADTGWYTSTSTDTVTNFRWGYQAGCDLFNRPCVYMNNANFDEFCIDEHMVPKCNHNFTHKGFCNIIEHESALPPEYDWLANDKTYLGGADKDTNYCPYVGSAEGGDCRNPDLNDYAQYQYGEKYCANCRCVEGNAAPMGYIPQKFAGCFEIDWVDANTMTVWIAGTQVSWDITTDIPTVVQLPGFNGFFTCPSRTICTASFASCIGSCYANGTCTFNGCECDDGFYGDDCLSLCDLSCLTCNGPGANQCLSCKENATLEGSTCTCDETYRYIVPTGDCSSTCGANWSDNSVSGQCSVNTATPGYYCYMVGTTVTCDGPQNDDTNLTDNRDDIGENCPGPMRLDYRLWFYGETCNWYDIEEINYGNSFTIELWFKHHRTKKTLYSTSFDFYEHTSSYYHFDIWITHCQQIGLDWGYEQYFTSRQAVNQNEWNHLAVVVERKSDTRYLALDDFQYIEIYVNGHPLGGGVTQLLFERNIECCDIVGADQFHYYTFYGFMYYWGIWNYALDVEDFYFATDCNVSCEQCPDDAIALDIEDYEGERDIDCLPACHHNYWFRTQQESSDHGSFYEYECMTCHTSCEYGCSNFTFQNGDYWYPCEQMDLDGNDCDTLHTHEFASDWTSDVVDQSDCSICRHNEACLVCSADHELDCVLNHVNTQVSTCVDCPTSGCTYNDLRQTANEYCTCNVAQFWDTATQKCVDCHEGCAKCFGPNVYQCSECNSGYYLMFRASTCSKYCPTGVTYLFENDGSLFHQDHNRCDYQFEEINFSADDVHHTLQLNWNSGIFMKDHTNSSTISTGNFAVFSGEQYGCGLGADPIPIKNRGIWFDGQNQYLTLQPIMVDTRFSLAFLLRSQISHLSEAVLFGNYKPPDKVLEPGLTLYSFGIVADRGIFRDQGADQMFQTEDIVAPYDTWTVVSFSVELVHALEQTEIKIYTNESLVETQYYTGAIVDSMDFYHFIGGIRHELQLNSAYRGFMASFKWQNFVATATTGLYSPDSWPQTCPVCDTLNSNVCLSNCQPFEFENEYTGECHPCDITCVKGCVRWEDCGLCHDFCNSRYACDGFTTADCSP